MEEPKLVSSFYKYVAIGDPIGLQQQQIGLCSFLGLKGRIMVGEEGINGCVYGKKGSVSLYQEKLRQIPYFSDMEFKDQIAEKAAYRKLFVRVRKEIVNFGLKTNLKNKGRYVTPAELKELLDNHEDIVLVDVRNNYETRIGKFRNAVALNVRNFRDLPSAIGKIENSKNKKIITYCTGGIRCEKASAFLRENGFENVHQLKGGILKFGEEFPDTYWQGKCFVFDYRLAVQFNNKNTGPLAECFWCSSPCDDYLNCHNIECDKLFICCGDCREKHNKSCSEECSMAPKRREGLLLACNING